MQVLLWLVAAFGLLAGLVEAAYGRCVVGRFQSTDGMDVLNPREVWRVGLSVVRGRRSVTAPQKLATLILMAMMAMLASAIPVGAYLLVGAMTPADHSTPLPAVAIGAAVIALLLVCAFWAAHFFLVMAVSVMIEDATSGT